MKRGGVRGAPGLLPTSLGQPRLLPMGPLPRSPARLRSRTKPLARREPRSWGLGRRYHTRLRRLASRVGQSLVWLARESAGRCLAVAPAKRLLHHQVVIELLTAVTRLAHAARWSQPNRVDGEPRLMPRLVPAESIAPVRDACCSTISRVHVVPALNW